MMSQFKVGDRVSWEGQTEIGTILKLSNDGSSNLIGDGDAALVDFNMGRPLWYTFNQLELVERAEPLDAYLPKDHTHLAWQSNAIRIDEAEVLSRKSSIPKVGIKHDQAKPDLSLLPKEFLEEVAKAFMHGEKKYGRYNYRNGMDWHRLVAAAQRHITAFNEGENTDVESGFSHLGHAGACMAMLCVYQARGLGKDTRYKP